jgi:hypothetical protein
MSQSERYNVRDCWSFNSELHLRLKADGDEMHVILSLAPNDIDDLRDALQLIEEEPEYEGA